MNSSPSNVPEFSVLEFSRRLKNLVEDNFGYVRIRGEVVNSKKASSGHLYFTLREQDSSLSAVCFRSSLSGINFELFDGLQICVFGRITTFEGRSSYQIIVEKAQLDGIGAIIRLIELRKEKLRQEGLFDQIHKKLIPKFPKSIGVITSKTGAVIEDIKSRIESRFPCLIKLYPVTVQGEMSAREVINAIKYFNNLESANAPSVIIIARGGGSLEDLFPFNDEQLAREVFASKIPIISAIGHETDFTILDLVADLRAPTPTAAAEIATPSKLDLASTLELLHKKNNQIILRHLTQLHLSLERFERYLISPQKSFEMIRDRVLSLGQIISSRSRFLLEWHGQRISKIEPQKAKLMNLISLSRANISGMETKMSLLVHNSLARVKSNLDFYAKNLNSHHYKSILKRGFALIKDQGNFISSVEQLKPDNKVEIELFDGSCEAIITKKSLGQ